MNPLQAIVHEFLMLSGVLAWFGLAICAFYWLTSGDDNESGKPPKLQLTVLDSDTSKDDCVSYVTAANDTGRFAQNKSIADWLDDAIEPRAKLQYIHRRICERAGIDPGITNELGDLITEAVFDGFRRNACIDRVEQLTNQMEQSQNA